MTSAKSIDTCKRVAVITGCSEINSMGAAFARELLYRGWIVFATARNEATLQTLGQEGCLTLQLDVTSESSVSEAVRRVTTLTGGRMDLLINNVRQKGPRGDGAGVEGHIGY